MDTIKVLLVDDNPDDLEACQRALAKSTRCKFIISIEEIPEKAIARCKQEQFDCVLIDFYFPNMSGLELLVALKNLGSELAVIVLTGQADEAKAVSLLKKGAQDYLNKRDINTDSLETVLINSVNAERAAFSLNNSKELNILIIDDNQDDIEFCSRLLTRASKAYQVVPCIDGDKAMNLLAEHSFECVLLDYSLPGKDGLVLLEEIHSTYPYVPVVFMTGQGNEKIAVEAIKSGAENYLVKGSLNLNTLDKSIRDAIEKKTLEKKLADKEQELINKQAELSDAYNFQKLIFKLMPDYIFVKDEALNIVNASDAFLKLYPNDARASVLGNPALNAFKVEDPESLMKSDQYVLDNGFVEEFESVTCPNGEFKKLFTTKQRFSNAKGQKFILSVARDVTEREKLIQELSKSNSDLEEFAYVASHDLKAPLNAIKKLISWIEEDYMADFDDELKSHFSLIKNRAERMAKLLDDLLQYSRLNRKRYQNELIDMKTLVQELREFHLTSDSFLIEFQGCNLNLPRVAVLIVLNNFISNALKHHDQTSGVIKLTTSEQDNTYCIRIEDDGPGIDFEYKDKIFQMFQTLRPRDQVEGSGMGLAMVKKLVEFYGASVELVNSNLRGAAFEVRWPKYWHPDTLILQPASIRQEA